MFDEFVGLFKLYYSNGVPMRHAAIAALISIGQTEIAKQIPDNYFLPEVFDFIYNNLEADYSA